MGGKFFRRVRVLRATLSPDNTDSRRCRANLSSPFCRSRILSDETRNPTPVSGGGEDKIAFIENKPHAQIAPDAAFVESAERPYASAGMQMGPPENVGQSHNRGIHSRLLCRRQPLERAEIRRPGENHGRQGWGFPARGSLFILARTLVWAASTG